MDELSRVLSSNGTAKHKGLYRKALGQFYTHELVALQMIDALIARLPVVEGRPVQVVEPFAGDGRLVEKFIELMALRANLRSLSWQFHLWEVQEEAAAMAAKAVSGAIARAGINATISTFVGDTFQFAPKHYEAFDICITNPPWEVLRPDSRDLEELPKEEASAYLELIRQRSHELAKAFPQSVPTRRFAGWGINLARCGVELSLNLLRRGGICAIVSPSSLLGDQVSSPLRKWLFERHNVHEVTYYVPEARLFDLVDQASITLVASKGAPTVRSPQVSTVDAARHRESHQISDSAWKSLQESGYVFPLQFGLPLLEVLGEIRHLPRFRDLEGSGPEDLWAGRELDETGHQRYMSPFGKYAFLKGRMVSRYQVLAAKDTFVAPTGPSIPASANYYRVAWRDVTRLSQKRRMQAAIIPPGVVTGNSLHVAHFRDSSLVRLRALLGVMNSLVFEAQARMNLSTSHMSLGAIRRVRVPALRDPNLVRYLSDIVADVERGRKDSETVLEVRVAQLYGFSREQFLRIVSEFPQPVLPSEHLDAESLWKLPPAFDSVVKARRF